MEKAARRAWVEWGNGYALFARCGACGERAYVRGPRRSKLRCLECFDQGKH